MGKIIGICNQKGGVGKTTTTLAFGKALVDCGYKVLLVDLDDSGNPTLSMTFNLEDHIPNSTDLLNNVALGRGLTDINSAICRSEEGFDILPTDHALAGVSNLINGLQTQDERHKFEILKKVISTVKDNYDFILIDAAPSLDIIFTNLIVAADEIIVASQAQETSVEGIEQLVKTLIDISESRNQNLRFGGILLTMVDNRSASSQNMAEGIRKMFLENKIPVFNTMIPRSVEAEKCFAAKQSVIAFNKTCKPATAYQQFVKEYLG